MEYVKSDGIPRLEVFGFGRIKNRQVFEDATFKLKQNKVKHPLKVHTFFFDESDTAEQAVKFIYDTLAPYKKD